MAKTVALLGPYPKPYGGISIHIKRLKEQLERKGVACLVYDNSGIPKEENNVIPVGKVSKWFLGQLLHNTANIIHQHGYNPKLLGLLCLLGAFKRKKVITTLHSFRYDSRDMKVSDKLAFWLAKIFRVHFITVGPEIKEKIVSLGIKPENIDVIPAFIPPAIEGKDTAEIPPEVWRFIDTHKPVIAANAFRIAFHNGQDLYGLDMCIDLCASLKQTYPQVGFVFCLPAIGDYEYFERIQQEIVKREIENNFLFQTKPCEMYPILLRSDLFVRPTNADGYGVSIAEAIHFNVCAVASDACSRPEGTILFRNRDIRDFTSKVKDMLDNHGKYKKRVENIKLNDDVGRILTIYSRLENKV